MGKKPHAVLFLMKNSQDVNFGFQEEINGIRKAARERPADIRFNLRIHLWMGLNTTERCGHFV